MAKSCSALPGSTPRCTVRGIPSQGIILQSRYIETILASNMVFHGTHCILHARPLVALSPVHAIPPDTGRCEIYQRADMLPSCMHAYLSYTPVCSFSNIAFVKTLRTYTLHRAAVHMSALRVSY